MIKKLGRNILGERFPLGYTMLHIQTLLQTNQGECLVQWFPIDGTTTGEILLATKFFPTANVKTEPKEKQPSQSVDHGPLHSHTNSLSPTLLTKEKKTNNIKKEPDKKEKQQTTKREATEVPKPKVVQDLNSSEKKINPNGDTIPSQPQQAHPNPSSQQSPPSQTNNQPATQTNS